MESEPEYYRLISEYLDIMEGETLQNIYFLFKTMELKENDDFHEGIRIPSFNDIEMIREKLKKIMDERHRLFIKDNLYNNFL